MVEFLIKNNYTGAYVYENLFEIKRFCTMFQAEIFVRDRGLNTEIYAIEAVKTGEDDDGEKIS